MQSFQSRDTPGMVLVAGVHQRDERSGIHEDQERLRRSLMSLAKRRPACWERFGFVP